MIRQGDETRRRGFWFRILRKAEEALQPTKRVMNPWEIWLWPWIAASTLTRGALETGRGSMEANDGDVALPRVSEPEWASPNHVTSEFDAMRVRDFSVAWSKQRSTLIVAPFALHDARIADLSSGHSLIETLRANGCSRLFLVEWKSATAKTKLRTIDSYLCDLNVAVDDIGPPVDLIGLCQGGWLSLVYAARFAGKVRRLVLAGAPIDLMAEPSLPSAEARITPEAVIDDMIRAGDGLVLGRTLLELWPREHDESAFVIDALQFPGAPANEKDRRTVETFLRWQRRTLDLPGPYFLEVSTGSFVRTASPQAGSMRSAASSICVSCAARCFSSLAIEPRSRRRDKSWRRRRSRARGRAMSKWRLPLVAISLCSWVGTR